MPRQIKMIYPKRHNKSWSIPETMKLIREYELIGMSVQQIARAHNRSVLAILFKLHAEHIIPAVPAAKGYTEFVNGWDCEFAPH